VRRRLLTKQQSGQSLCNKQVHLLSISDGRTFCHDHGVATGRFAPSPTGVLHLGNLRTALVAWLSARSSGGRFIVRMEDLDRVTSRPEHAASQMADLAAIGLDWDGEVVNQSDRFDLHRDAIARLSDAGLTYTCFCTRREIQAAASAPHGLSPEGFYPGTCRDMTVAERWQRARDGRLGAIRLSADGVTRSFTDAICGQVEATVDDVVLARNDGVPAYNLAVVVDDELQGVEEVVRGDDLVTSTPRQILIGELLGFRSLSYVHVPLVLNAAGERLAKRDAAATLADRLAIGDTPDSVRALLAASLGLCEPTDRPTMRELVTGFDVAKIATTPWRLPPP
jgi:glutamyl-tRNA synthetase